MRSPTLLPLFLSLFLSLGAWSQTRPGIPYRTEGTPYALERCTLDVYSPESETPLPVVVWFHGGGLTEGDKSSIPSTMMCDDFVLVSVNYRLLSHEGTSIDDPIDDAAAAVAWTFKNIAKYGGRDDEIFVAGHSAGGYLTDLIGLDKKWLASYGVDADSIAGLFPFSGQVISHFAYRRTLGMSPLQPSIDKYAPLYYVRGDAPPIFIISADREQELLGRYEETAYFWRMLTLSGHPAAYLYELDGFNHGTMAEPAGLILRTEIRNLLQNKENNK